MAMALMQNVDVNGGLPSTPAEPLGFRYEIFGLDRGCCCGGAEERWCGSWDVP